ncbi:uncharacterized protein LOC143222773 isoform X2 [Tachypleus tridentatus]
MVTGMCQHRICTECLYDSENGALKTSMSRCPTCQKSAVFPPERPNIPEDNILIQKMLGVRQCPNSGCFNEFWEWELSDHLKECSHNALKLRKSDKKRARSVSCVQGTSPLINEAKIFQYRKQSQKLACNASGKCETLISTGLRKRRKTAYDLREIHTSK